LELGVVAVDFLALEDLLDDLRIAFEIMVSSSSEVDTAESREGSNLADWIFWLVDSLLDNSC